MVNEIISNIIERTLNSFDIPFCITINIATYLVIKTYEDFRKGAIIGTWSKRLIFLIVSIIIACIYCFTGSEYKVILNSFILAPVSWSWIFKPICAKLKIDYNKDAVCE